LCDCNFHLTIKNSLRIAAPVSISIDGFAGPRRF
jgi:hypothetical protein